MGKKNSKNPNSEGQQSPKEKKKESVAVYGNTEDRSYKILRIICISVLVISICSFLFIYFHNQKATDTVAETEYVPSMFKTMLDAEVEKLSKDGKKYSIDEEYYNEDNAKTFVSVMTEVKESSITGKEIAQCIDKLFMSVMMEENVYRLIQKDSFTLISEREEIAKMNMLDYKFLGTENTELTKISKGFYISQNNPEFLNIPYGSSNVCVSGCGIVSVAMAVNYVSGANVVTVEEVAAWANENNMYEENSGSKWALMRNCPAVFGVKSQELYTTRTDVLSNYITNGQVLITSMNNGHFTNSGHIIVIMEIKDGMATVLDPSSIYRSLQKWDLQLILDESNNYFWKIYK